MDRHDAYESPLASRNASPEMLRLFSARHKHTLWRRIWLELARAQRALGLDRVSQLAIDQMAAAVDSIDFAKAAEWEKRLRHDVMAHVHTFQEAAPAAKGIVHLGATSQDVVDNADLIIYKDALTLVRDRLAAVIVALGEFAMKWADTPCLSYTHYQPAQLSTVGKRATLWAYEFVQDFDEISRRIETLPFRGIKGTTGTQASFLALFDNDPAKVDALDAAVRNAFGFTHDCFVTGQTYSRKIDARIVGDLANVAASVHRVCNDIRLLAGSKQIEEPFEAEQVGSSAMAYKRNPMRCERATGLARFVISLSTSPLQTAAEQWLERTLDDSSNRRLTMPESFLAIDGCLLILTDVARGLVAYPRTIAAAVDAELPFMATEDILMAAVRAGGDRQELHEAIRVHSLAAAEQVKSMGKPNDLIERLRGDRRFAAVDLDAVLDPGRYTGRSGEQVRAFYEKFISPLKRQFSAVLSAPVVLRV